MSARLPALAALLAAALAGETIRGGALTPDGSTVITWGRRLLAWKIPALKKTVLRGAGVEFGEGGCLVDVDGDGRTDIVVQEGPGAGKMVWFQAPDWKRREIESDTEFHDCLGATLLGHRGILMVHRHGQVRFYEPPADPDGAWSAHEIYSFYTPSNQTGLLISDVDGDGRPDILCGNYWIRSPESFELPWRLYAINTYSEAAESAMLRLALAGGLVVSQGHVAAGKLARFEKPADPKQLWSEQRLDGGLNLRYPHALAVLPSGEIVAGENNGTASRLILLAEKGPRVIARGLPALAVFATGEGLVVVGPDGVRYLRR